MRSPASAWSYLIFAAAVTAAAETNPPWAARAPNGDRVRIAVAPPPGSGLNHLAWPKAVRLPDGTIVLGYQAGTQHGSGSSPAISVSTDGGRTFSPPQILRKFGRGEEYQNSGNMALGVAHDGAAIVLSHGHTGDKTNHIFGWRSTDGGRTWKPVDTSGLGPDKSGSSTGGIVQLPGKKLMAVGHYRGGSKPYTVGIWSSVSEDDGLSWGPPQMINNLNAGEPVIVRHGDRLLVFIRGRGPAAVRQYVAVSADWGRTWQTDLLNIVPRNPHTTVFPHPFAMVDPHDGAKILAVTFERPLPGVATLWRADAKTLAFKAERNLLELPKLAGDPHTDYGYAWLLPTEGRKALVFYYHGARAGGACPIWVLETEI